MSIKPKGDVIIVEKLEKKQLIELPEGSEKFTSTWLVKASGPGHWEFGKFLENDIKPGDIVLIGGAVATANLDTNHKVRFARARDVIAII